MSGASGAGLSGASGAGLSGASGAGLSGASGAGLSGASGAGLSACDGWTRLGGEMATDRKRADWSTLLGAEDAGLTVIARPARTELAPVLAGFDELLAVDDSDAIVKRAVEIARDRMGLTRVGVFLHDERHGRMLGTWGTDLDGTTVDEHSVTYAATRDDLDVFRRAAERGAYWVIVHNAPIVVHRPCTRVAGRGWLCCTPIRSARGIVGVMFNDAGLSGMPLDDRKQARIAVVSSLLGTVLDLAQGPSAAATQPEAPWAEISRHPVVERVMQLLAENPSLTSEALGPAQGLSASRVARVFKAETGMSLVEYRHRLRMERLSAALDKSGGNLLAAALEAGFGSYSQFHRVFCALHGMSPRAYLRRNR